NFHFQLDCQPSTVNRQLPGSWRDLFGHELGVYLLGDRGSGIGDQGSGGFVMRLSIALAAVVLLGSVRIDGQVQRVSMQGVWRVAEVNIAGPKPQTIVFGESRPN